MCTLLEALPRILSIVQDGTRKTCQTEHSSSHRLGKTIPWAVLHLNAMKCCPFLRFSSLLTSCSEMRYATCLCTMICFTDTSQKTKCSLVSQTEKIIRGLRVLLLPRNRSQSLSPAQWDSWVPVKSQSPRYCRNLPGELSRQWARRIHGRMPPHAHSKNQSNKKKPE